MINWNDFPDWTDYTPLEAQVTDSTCAWQYAEGHQGDSRYVVRRVQISRGTIGQVPFEAYCIGQYAGGNVTTVTLAYSVNGICSAPRKLIKRRFMNISRYDVNDAINMVEVNQEHKAS